jgi:perosamine synthetase
MTGASGNTEAMRLLGDVLASMPDPAAAAQSRALEAELAAAFGTGHAVAVSSGTAALHTALAACGIGAGDEVLIPALTVVMTVAAVAATGARPVLVDAVPGGQFTDLDDLAAKITARSRAVLPVHFAGRTGDMDALLELATSRGLPVIEDACQAQGSRYRGRLGGTLGLAGCFSLKDGKIISCGEGGYLLTSDPAIAARAAAFRNHGLAAGARTQARTALGLNYRLAEPLAAIARPCLAGLDEAIAMRRRQTQLLSSLTGIVDGLSPLPAPPDEQPNGYAALWLISRGRPRGLSEHLAACGVPNSTGSFGFRAASADPACRNLRLNACPHAEAAADRILAVPVTARTSDEQISEMAAIIRREAQRWEPC